MTQHGGITARPHPGAGAPPQPAAGSAPSRGARLRLAPASHSASAQAGIGGGVGGDMGSGSRCTIGPASSGCGLSSYAHARMFQEAGCSAILKSYALPEVTRAELRLPCSARTARRTAGRTQRPQRSAPHQRPQTHSARACKRYGRKWPGRAGCVLRRSAAAVAAAVPGTRRSASATRPSSSSSVYLERV